MHKKMSFAGLISMVSLLSGGLAAAPAFADLPASTPANCGKPPLNAPCYPKPVMIHPPEESYLQGPLHQPNMKIEALSDQHDFWILPAIPATTTWGYFDSSLPPALTIRPGDTVAIETLPGAGGNVAPGMTIEQLEYLNAAVEGRGPHTMTGPIKVEGAHPPSALSAGDVLAVRINKIRMRSYATNNSGDFAGLFSEYGQGGPYQSPVFPHFVSHFIDSYYLDSDRMEAVFQKSPRIVIPLNPFPGILAVARSEADEQVAYSGHGIPSVEGPHGWCVQTPPAPLKGPGCNTKQPGNFGGNLDLPAMTVGSVTYLPVFREGGLLWTGDSHAAQGNGEIDLDALETAFTEMNVTIDVLHRKDHPEFGDQPVVENAEGWVTIGYAISLNKALENLKLESKRFLMAKFHLSDAAAETRLIETWNCPISEVVDEVLGTYCIHPKTDHPKRSKDIPRKDTATHWVSFAEDDLDLMTAMKKAAYESVRHVAKEAGISEARSYRLMTFVQDCRIGRPGSPGLKYQVACTVPKAILKK